MFLTSKANESNSSNSWLPAAGGQLLAKSKKSGAHCCSLDSKTQAWHNYNKNAILVQSTLRSKDEKVRAPSQTYGQLA